MKYNFIFISTALFFLLAAFLSAGNYFVSPLGNDANDGSIEYPWRSIAHAMSMIPASSSEWHNLHVASGFYEEMFSFKEYVNAYGGYDAQLWQRNMDAYPTFLKKADNSPFILANNMILDGFTFYSGVECVAASPDIRNCRIFLSRTSGVKCSYGSSPHIIDCVIKQCLGDGITIFSGASPLIENTVIAMCGGDGVRIEGDSHPDLYHVTVAHNLEAGVRLEDPGSVTISNSIIWENGKDLVNCHAIHSCVSEGDFYYHDNSTDDPLFVGWGGFNENFPLYVSTTGSDQGTGEPQSPKSRLSQAMAFFSYRLSISSPYIGSGSDGLDTGAYPSSQGYDPYRGNVGKILVMPGDYFETDVIISVPVHISGISGYNPRFSLGDGTGFLWRTSGGVTSVSFDGGNVAIRQYSGDMFIKDAVFSGASRYGIYRAAGKASLDNVVIRDCVNGVLSERGLSLFMDCLFENNDVGLLSGGDSAPQVSRCRFISNTTAVACWGNSQPDIRQSLFSGNNSFGVLAVGQASATIAMNRFENNNVGIHGGDFASMKIFSNFIHDHSSKGIVAENSSTMKIINNTICYNRVGARSYDPSAVEIRNCVIRDNAQASLDNCVASYSNVSGEAPGEGNFDLVPLFIDAEKRDFHISADSPCRDAGKEPVIFFRDFDGEPRPMGEGVDIGADEFSETWKYVFAEDSQGWKTVSVPNFFTPPLFDSSGGYLTLQSADSNTYGAWESPPGSIVIDRGRIYRFRFRIRGNVTDIKKSPGLRLRINSLDAQWIDKLAVFSIGESAASPPQNGKNYDMYMFPAARTSLYPRDKEDLFLSVDLVNFDVHDESQASLFLEDVAMTSIPIESLFPEILEKRYEFEIGSEGWQTGGAKPIFAEPYFYLENSSIVMQSTNNWSCYGFWETLVSGFELRPGLLYRVEYVMRSDVSSELVPTFRIRISTQDGAVNYLRIFNSSGDASASLKNHNQAYSYYFVPPPEYCAGSCRGLRLSLDMVNFNLQDERRAIIWLDRVSIYSSNLPEFY